MSSAAAGAEPLRVRRIRLEPLDRGEVVRDVSHAAAGAVVTFEGVVRDTNEGRPVTRLDYEAYSTMAELEMQRVLDEVAAEFDGARVSALHRVGALEVEDLAVVCAASAPHRGEAFAACRALIDRIKERLPIWKREHGPDGPYWVGWKDARCSDHAGHAVASTTTDG